MNFFDLKTKIFLGIIVALVGSLIVLFSIFLKVDKEKSILKGQKLSIESMYTDDLKLTIKEFQAATKVVKLEIEAYKMNLIAIDMALSSAEKEVENLRKRQGKGNYALSQIQDMRKKISEFLRKNR